MLDIFSSVKGLLKLQTIKIDNGVFQLHYKWTGALLLAFSVLVTSNQYIGDPIDCVVDEIPQKVMDNYCWIYSTFTVPEQLGGRIGKDIVQPGVGGHVHDEDEIKYHQYYQWVCFTLVFQFLLFQIPRYLWKMWEGGRLRALTFDLQNPAFNEEKKDERVSLINQNFSRSYKKISVNKFLDKVLIPFLSFIVDKRINAGAPDIDNKTKDYYTSYFRNYLRSNRSDSFRKAETRNEYVKLFSDFLKKDPMFDLDKHREELDEKVRLLLTTSGFTQQELLDACDELKSELPNIGAPCVNEETLKYLKKCIQECGSYMSHTQIDLDSGFNKESFKMDIRRRDETRKTMAWKFFFCEILNLINVIGQIYFMDYFLGGEFSTYGTDVVMYTEMDPEKRDDPMSIVFPKVTKCTFNKFGPSGTVQRFDGLCVLPLNIINEKIYVFLWFWFVILSVVTGVWVLWSLRFFLLSNKARNQKALGIESSTLTLGDTFLLKQIKDCVDPLIFEEIKLAITEDDEVGRERKMSEESD